MVQEAQEEQAKKERHRSPNYPAVSLREGIERVRKLYQVDGRAGAPPGLAAKHIGFSSAHGSAMAVVAALKRFGLVSETNGRLVPTQRAIEILNLPESDPRRANALREAALSPAIYGEIFESHKSTGLPADDVLEAELVTYRGFNPKAVSGFVRDFKDTLDFAGINVNGELESVNNELSGGDMSTPAFAQQQEERSKQLRVSVGVPAMEAVSQGQPTIQSYSFALSMPRNVRAELKFFGQVTKSDVERLKKQIEFLEEQFDEQE